MMQTEGMTYNEIPIPDDMKEEVRIWRAQSD